MRMGVVNVMNHNKGRYSMLANKFIAIIQIIYCGITNGGDIVALRRMWSQSRSAMVSKSLF